ncbi:hypothetical protein Dimus_029049 [Dionaea muscipula]
MADVMLDFLQIFRNKIYSNQLESATLRELQSVMAYKAKGDRMAAAAGVVAGGLAWMAASPLDKFSRGVLAGGAGYKSWMWGLGRSVDSVLEYILAWDGSQMQHELSKIMLQKYSNDPKKKKLLSKYFYPEKVFDDSKDQPTTVYRQRNMYVDQAVQLQNLHLNYSGEIGNDMNRPSLKNDLPASSGEGRINSENGQVQVDHMVSIFVDPLDSLLGYSVGADQPECATVPARVSSHPSRRLHHRSRRHHRHHKDSD